jgi:hypothetical protein
MFLGDRRANRRARRKCHRQKHPDHVTGMKSYRLAGRKHGIEPNPSNPMHMPFLAAIHF